MKILGQYSVFLCWLLVAVLALFKTWFNQSTFVTPSTAWEGLEHFEN